MKKTILVISIFLAIIAIFSGNFSVKNECVRVHIRANSDLTCDQNVKYIVKDEIVKYLTPYVSDLKSSSEAKSVIESKLNDIKLVADRTLKRNGYDYEANVKLCKEKFPARVYDKYVLEEGVYDALIIELGEASGKNWWCVLFPPLCFTPMGEGDTVTYKSKIAELCKEIFGT